MILSNVSNYVQIFAGLATVLSVFYAGYQIRLLRKTHSENHDWNRRNAAQQAIKEYRDIQLYIETLSEHFDYINQVEGIPKSVFEKEFKENQNLQSRLHIVLNYFEGLSRGVRQGVFDEEIIKAAFKGQIIRIHDAFRYYIDSRRKSVSNPKVFIEFEEIADMWKREDRNLDPTRDKTG